jgi:very-short-patch-repair endonuclease
VLRKLAARQHGVVARRQLLAAGLSSKMIERRAAGRQLVRLHAGVYAVGHARLCREGHWLAAVLAVGPQAVLSHRDAAALHGLRRPGDHARWEVTTTTRSVSTKTIRVFNTVGLDASDVTTVQGIPATSIARTLVDLAATVPTQQLHKALNEAERLRLADLSEIEGALHRTRHRNGHGHAAMRAALTRLRELGASHTRSELEDRFLALLDAHALPRPHTNHWLGDMEVDACWPARRLVVELDGWSSHSTRQAFQDDRERSNALQRRGWRLLRFTYADVTRRPERTAGEVAHALAAPRRYPPTP